jgi:hypothetical protein
MNMEIRHSKLEPYFIKGTANSFDVYLDEKKKDKNGNPVTSSVGYYHKLGGAVKKIVWLNMLDKNDAMELTDLVNEFKKELNDIIKSIQL